MSLNPTHKPKQMVVKDISNNPQQRSIDSHDAIENKLEQAMSFHQMGQLQRAEEIC